MTKEECIAKLNLLNIPFVHASQQKSFSVLNLLAGNNKLKAFITIHQHTHYFKSYKRILIFLIDTHKVYNFPWNK